ncbi:uncharacterized protein [Arachis hypogaea]|uniref:uncharacterized protein n=1 Tax=Arachis hypogaea TaxID=3818 RepID=UPI000DEC152F|nr:uncharacterized protein LOC112721694 [Arachis hypogaea]
MGPSDKELSKCKRCRTSRWKQKTNKNSRVRINRVVKKNEKPQAEKTLRYFPLIPRLQQFYMSSKTDADILCHKSGHSSDGICRHPQEGEAWKAFDRTYFDFSSDLCSVRLALASDGFNPYGNMSSKYSIWLVPLIDELKLLWVGVETYDTYTKKTFRMYAALMWTISYFPGLGNLSRWNTYGGRACPACNLDSETNRLTHSQKWCFRGHRHFLNPTHRCRKDRDRFDGKIEDRGPLVNLPGGDIARQLQDVHVHLGKVQSVVGKRTHRQICSKSIDPQQLSLLQDHVVHILCRMEMIFPPSFFTVMVHLMVHLVEEVQLGGPVQYRWMYPIERYLCRLKQYVRNRSQPEGSIVEGYLSEEILIFCSRYLDNVESRINRPMRADDRPCEHSECDSVAMFPGVGKAVGAASAIIKRQLRSRTRSQSHIDSVVHRDFFEWFKREVKPVMINPVIDGILFVLSQTDEMCNCYLPAYNVNGFRFRTLSREEGLKTQNSGVHVTSDTRSYASKRDSNVAVGGVLYYGKLVDIIELNYSGQFTVILFRCIWTNTTSGRGIKQDVLGHTLVNFSNLIHVGDREDDEPYILASKAHLV